jgi:hypothetical protein
MEGKRQLGERRVAMTASKSECVNDVPPLAARCSRIGRFGKTGRHE